MEESIIAVAVLIKLSIVVIADKTAMDTSSLLGQIKQKKREA